MSQRLLILHRYNFKHNWNHYLYSTISNTIIPVNKIKGLQSKFDNPRWNLQPVKDHFKALRKQDCWYNRTFIMQWQAFGQFWFSMRTDEVTQSNRSLVHPFHTWQIRFDYIQSPGKPFELMWKEKTLPKCQICASNTREIRQLKISYIILVLDPDINVKSRQKVLLFTMKNP